MDPLAVLVLSASNGVRAANLGEAALNNQLVAFNLLPNTETHPPFSRRSRRRHATSFPATNGRVLIPHFARTHTFSSGRETHGSLHLGTMTRETERVLDEILITTCGRARPSLSIMIDLRDYISLPPHSERHWSGSFLYSGREFGYSELQFIDAHLPDAVLRMTNSPDFQISPRSFHTSST